MFDPLHSYKSIILNKKLINNSYYPIWLCFALHYSSFPTTLVPNSLTFLSAKSS